MKKIVPMVVALLLIGSNISVSASSATGEAPPAADEEIPWPFVCEADELLIYKNKRYILSDGTGQSPAFAIDTKTMKIDKKNKRITLWMDSLLSQSGREGIVESQEAGDDYSDVGVTKLLIIFDYNNPRYMIKAASFFNCSGKSIYTGTSEGTWALIQPGTGYEVIMDVIIEKFNLK